MAQPQKLSDLIDADLGDFKTLETKNQSLAEECRRAFGAGLDGSFYEPARSATASSHRPNISNGPDSPKRTSTQVAPQTVLTPGDPLCRRASEDEIVRMLLEVGFETGHVISKERAQLMAKSMYRAGWMAAEVEYARHAVVSDPDLLKEIGYERTIGPGVFALARQTKNVARGRLFTHQEAVAWCNRLDGDRELLGDEFEVVRVEGVANEDGTLKPWWRLK